MTNTQTSNVAIVYDDEAYQEVLTSRGRQRPGQAAGLMGRQVAGKEFLDAYLTHGSWDELLALTRGAASSQSLVELCRKHPSSRTRERRLRMFSATEFSEQFLKAPPAPNLYFPCPPDARFAWLRQKHSQAYALSGVTHTLCSLRAIEAIRNLVVAPFETHDRLVCTSTAVVNMVRSLCDTYCDYLRDRFGGALELKPKLEQIPLGVNVDRYRPATADERNHWRTRFGISESETVVLFVGRFAHHAKAHPFPLYEAAARAVQRTSRPIRLLMAGWAPSKQVLSEFKRAAQQIARGVTVQFVDGVDAAVREGVWRAADVFMSPSDNLQETFGLVIVEAMASGLPVVASDWDGYRDLVAHEETGFLTRTSAVSGALEGLAERLLMGELSYDQFLASTSQCVRVDVEQSAASLVKLIESPELRTQMGRAGRERVEKEFAWSRVVSAYESMWAEQQKELERAGSPSPRPVAACPPLESMFAGYPSAWLTESTTVIACENAAERLKEILSLPLMNHAADDRITNVELLIKALTVAQDGADIGALQRILVSDEPDSTRSLTTISWMLKYALLDLEPPQS